MGLFDKIKEAKRQYDVKAEEEQQRAKEARERIQREEEEKVQRIVTGLKNNDLMQNIVALVIQQPWFSESQGSWDSNRRQIIVTPEVVSVNDYAQDDYFQVLERMYASDNNTVGIKISTSRRPLQDKNAEWVSEHVPYPDLGIRFANIVREKYSNGNCAYISYEGIGYSEIADAETLNWFAKVLQIVLQERYPELKFSGIHRNYFGLQAFEIYLPEKRRQSISIEDFK
ncbi:MAG: hypothetical protein IKK50_01720 [Ruminiclostridium sp.]|nr:hypothetical protein [Ruminiclostridium sp.]